MDRETCLTEAMQTICVDRNDQYGEPENNFKLIAKYWNVYLNSELTAEDVAIMMTLFKIARMNTGKPKLDNYIDAVGYLACGCEVMSKNV